MTENAMTETAMTETARTGTARTENAMTDTARAAPAATGSTMPRPTHLSRRVLLSLAFGGAALALSAIGFVAWLAALGSPYQPAAIESADATAPATTAQQQAARKLAALAPQGVHVVVDSFGGRLRIYQGEQVLREAVCSAGSGSALRDPRDGRLWVFETPLGERRVERKVRQPVWSKPDWAFVEEGRVPPPSGHPDRIDTVSLGDYALYLGDGYLIHGTLFQTTLGSPVTHGCIRLGDKDLEWVYANVPLGARVWLY